MDRQLLVNKATYILADIIFTYKTQTSGYANMTVNKIVDLGDGFHTFHPLYIRQMDFSHEKLNSIAEVEAFDQKFLRLLPDVEEQLNGDVEIIYPAIHRRYIIGTSAVLGIADVHANFLADKKELQFISAVHVNLDHKLQSDSLESNVTLLMRLCTLPDLNCPDAEFAEVNRK